MRLCIVNAVALDGKARCGRVAQARARGQRSGLAWLKLELKLEFVVFSGFVVGVGPGFFGFFHVVPFLFKMTS